MNIHEYKYIKKIWKWVNSVGIPVIIVTTLLNLSITIYEKFLDHKNQEKYLLLESKLEKEKEWLIQTRKDCNYLVNEKGRLKYQKFDYTKFFTSPFILKKNEIDKMMNDLFEAYQQNYIVYQKIKPYLDDKEEKKIEAYLKFYKIGSGTASFNDPLMIDTRKIANQVDHIGYGHGSAFFIKNLENGEFVDKFLDPHECSRICIADLLDGLEHFPHILSNIIDKHVKRIINSKM
jgi:hypothetical protein